MSDTKRVVIVVAATFVLCLGGYLVGSALRDASVHNLRQAVYGECHRQNVGRVTGNRNNYAQYKLWQATITLLTFNASPMATPKTNAQEAALFAAFIAAMRLTLRSESWTPLSNCAQATDHPASYTPPASVPFIQQLPPPSAFTIGAGE